MTGRAYRAEPTEPTEPTETTELSLPRRAEPTKPSRATLGIFMHVKLKEYRNGEMVLNTHIYMRMFTHVGSTRAII